MQGNFLVESKCEWRAFADSGVRKVDGGGGSNLPSRKEKFFAGKLLEKNDIIVPAYVTDC